MREENVRKLPLSYYFSNIPNMNVEAQSAASPTGFVQFS